MDFIASFLNITGIVQDPFISFIRTIPFITFIDIHLNQLKIINHFNQRQFFFQPFDSTYFDIVTFVANVLNFSLINFDQITI